MSTKFKWRGGEIRALAGQLKAQKLVLQKLIRKKRLLLKQIEKKQGYFNRAKKEHKEISKKLAAIFDDFESERDVRGERDHKIEKMLFPVTQGRIVKLFGKNVHKKFKTVTHHKGIEIQTPHQSPVLAALSGVVEFAGWVKGLGNVMILHHGGGVYTLSAHLFKIIHQKGDSISRGDTIALVGDTGRSLKPSLYFEVRKNGRAVDPLPYFEKDQLRLVL